MQDAKMQHQQDLEHLFNKNQLMSRVRNEFIECKDFNFCNYMQSKKIPVEFGIDLLAQMALHKRANVQTLVGCLRHHCTTAQECVDLLIASAEADLVDYSNDLRMFIVKFEISADVQAELDRFQFPLPMVVKPKEVQDNRDTGYFTSRGSIILRNNHHGDDVCLDHINRMNRIKLCINLNTATMVQNKWKNLDKPKEGETKEDFEKRRKAFAKYDKVAKDVIGLLIQEGNEFYLTHKYDKRGRTYCQGYHVTYQGAAWNKAVIEFSDKEMINE